jgi:hypothetical protein
MAVDSGDIAGMVVTIVITIAIAGTIVLRGPLGKALARAIELGAGHRPEDDGRVAQLEQRIADLEAGQARVAELEERVDFTERMLARAEPLVRVPGRVEGK